MKGTSSQKAINKSARKIDEKFEKFVTNFTRDIQVCKINHRERGCHDLWAPYGSYLFCESDFNQSEDQSIFSFDKRQICANYQSFLLEKMDFGE